MTEAPETPAVVQAPLDRAALVVRCQMMQSQFTFYAEQHRQKEPSPTRDEKVATNEKMAETGTKVVADVLALLVRLNTLEAFLGDVVRQNTYVYHPSDGPPRSERLPLGDRAAELLGLPPLKTGEAA